MFEMVLTVLGKRISLEKFKNLYEFRNVKINLSDKSELTQDLVVFADLEEGFKHTREEITSCIENIFENSPDFGLRVQFFDQEDRLFSFSCHHVTIASSGRKEYIVCGYTLTDTKVNEIEFAKFRFYHRAYDYFFNLAWEFIDFFLNYKVEVE